jgi:hypothetical protein
VLIKNLIFDKRKYSASKSNFLHPAIAASSGMPTFRLSGGKYSAALQAIGQINDSNAPTDWVY